MFETTVKHFVYDFCIGLVFDRWQSNFVSANGDIPKIGDYISRVSHVMADEHYYGCQVKNVITKTTKDGQPYFLAYVDYSSSKGIAIDEWEEEVAEYLDENEIDISPEALGEYEDDEYDIIEEDLDNLLNDEEIEFMEYPDMICLNSLYYVFYK